MGGMNVSKLTGDFGTLTIETEAIEVTSNLPKADRNWRYTESRR